MPAPFPADLREAVKAHSIIHGLRPAAAAFNIPVGTLAAWSARDKDGPWCPKDVSKLPAVVRPPTVVQTQAANTANTPSVAARNSEAERSAKGKLYGQRYVVQNLKYAAKLKGEAGLAVADKVRSVAATGQTVFRDWKDQAAPTNNLVNVQLIGLECPRTIDVTATATVVGNLNKSE